LSTVLIEKSHVFKAGLYLGKYFLFSLRNDKNRKKAEQELDRKESGAGFGNLADEGLKANIPKERPSFIRH